MTTKKKEYVVLFRWVDSNQYHRVCDKCDCRSTAEIMAIMLQKLGLKAHVEEATCIMPNQTAVYIMEN